MLIVDNSNQQVSTWHQNCHRYVPNRLSWWSLEYWLESFYFTEESINQEACHTLYHQDNHRNHCNQRSNNLWHRTYSSFTCYHQLSWTPVTTCQTDCSLTTFVPSFFTPSWEPSGTRWPLVCVFMDVPRRECSASNFRYLIHCSLRQLYRPLIRLPFWPSLKRFTSTKSSTF